MGGRMSQAKRVGSRREREDERERRPRRGRLPWWFWTALAIMAVMSCLITSVGMAVVNRMMPPNSHCPMCNHRFYRDDSNPMDAFRDVRCPKCGAVGPSQVFR
jgi:predicted RNA-binding Zn-ribbon protein involved in translation (DUF1610 family)